MRRQLNWWNSGAGQKLDELIESSRMSIEAVAEKAKVDAKTIRHWIDGQTTPNIGKLEQVLKSLGDSATHFASLKRAADNYLSGDRGGRVQTPAPDDLSHPHVRLKEKLRERALSGHEEAVQFLAPPGFLKTEVLRQLETETKLRRTALYFDALRVSDASMFWRDVAERFRRLGVSLPLESYSEPYQALAEGLENKSCVFLLDDADSWLVAHCSASDARTWFDRLVTLPCITIVSGLISLNSVLRMSGGCESPNSIDTLEWPRSDGWDHWTAQLCGERGIAAIAAADLEACARRQPRAFLKGLQAFPEGIVRARERVLQHHREVGRSILWQLPESLRSILRNGEVKTLDPKGREAKALVEAGILHHDGSGLTATVEEWTEAWANA